MADITFKLGKFNIPIYWKNMYEKARKSKAIALKLKCVECMCWQKSEIALCSIQECPLWIHRPYVRRPKNPNRKGNMYLKGRPGSIPNAK